MRRRQLKLLEALSERELEMLFTSFEKLEHAIDEMEASA